MNEYLVKMTRRGFIFSSSPREEYSAVYFVTMTAKTFEGTEDRYKMDTSARYSPYPTTPSIRPITTLNR